MAAGQAELDIMNYRFEQKTEEFDSRRKRWFRELVYDFLPNAFRIGLMGRDGSAFELRSGLNGRRDLTAEVCKQYLRLKYQDKAALVEDFILEFGGDDETKWGRVIDRRSAKEEEMEPLDLEFERWLNPMSRRRGRFENGLS